MTTNDNMSPEDKEFLLQCEEEFKDRYTENDKEFTRVFNLEPSKPPVVENWWVSQNSGRRNDRRFNRRPHPYERNNRDDRRGYNDYKDDRRGYQDYNNRYEDRGHGYNRRPRY